MDSAIQPAAGPNALQQTAATAPVPARAGMFLYLGLVYVLVSFGDPGGGLIATPVSFFLKNKLHLTASQVSVFQTLASIPVYLYALFGFIRDNWSPFGLKDRGFLLLAGFGCALLYCGFATQPMNYPNLLAAGILMSCATLFLWSTLNGLTATLGQQQGLAGQFSAAWSVFGAIVGIGTLLVGGSISDWMETLPEGRALSILYYAGAALMGLVGLIGLIGILHPTSVYEQIRPERSGPDHPLDEARRLLRYRPIYPALLIGVLWAFAPGSGTALQFHFQNTLHGTDAAFAQYSAISSAAGIPSFLLFGYLSRRLSLRSLLYGGTLAAIPQMIPLALIQSVHGAFAAAVVMGSLAGLAAASYTALLIRSCPPALQATTFALAGALGSMVGSLGDVLGSFLYERTGSFNGCVAATMVATALILPCLLLIPRDLIASADAGSATEPGAAAA